MATTRPQLEVHVDVVEPDGTRTPLLVHDVAVRVTTLSEASTSHIAQLKQRIAAAIRTSAEECR